MRFSSLWYLATVLVLAGPGLLAQDRNPITNGSFEQITETGLAPGWQFLGTVTVEETDAVDGVRALHLVRIPGTEGETGLNRDWAPSSGQQGAMLAQRKGAIRFHYLAVSEEKPGSLTVQIIPMNDKPLEVGGQRIRWTVPDEYVGDGQWHVGEFAYDFSSVPEVKWIHVSARIMGAGELWLDAFEWLPEIDAVPSISRMSFIEKKGDEGHAGTVEAILENQGSRPMARGQASILLPGGLTGSGIRVSTPTLDPGEETTLSWKIRGFRNKPQYKIRVRVKVGKRTCGGTLLLERDLTPLALRCASMIVKPGKAMRVELIARNTGHTILGEERHELRAPMGVQVQSKPLHKTLLPGQEAAIAAWEVTIPNTMPLVRLSTETGTGIVETQVVAAALRRPPASPRRSCYARRKNGWFLVGSRRTRLAIFEITDGVRGAWLQVRRRGRWRQVAFLPRLGLLRTPAGDVPLRFTEASIAEGDVSTLRLQGGTEGGDAFWTTVCTLTAQADSDVISYEITVSTKDESARLLAFEGPMLYSSRDLPERDDAILPGLEWLVKGEESSGSLDIKPEHPDRIRYVPHPRKITIPAVGMRFDHTVLGLLWDAPPAQPSYDVAGSAALVFASPDRFEGHTNHLMGLMLPGVDHGLPENARLLDKPVAPAPGQRLEWTLRAGLLASPAGDDSLLVLDRWLARNGVPAPLPYPRESAVGEIAFSLRAYAKDKALWNADWGKWYSDIIVGFRPTLEPARELLLGSKLIADPAVAAWARDLALETLELPPTEAEQSLWYHTDPEALRLLVRQAHVALAGQGEDGLWSFSGPKAADNWPAEGVDYDFLGPKGAKEVGISAAKTRQILQAAILSGDQELEVAGIRALEGMRRFQVPRAAQVWEVPVHTPDILASAYAAAAFLNGYRLTGEEEYLREAIAWARRGLPFVYMWGPADNPMMQGGTIPVFGATSYVLSWFGVAVQWNGLAYSRVLYDLAPLDPTFPWKQVADNILVSAMHQQAPQGERLGEWPDAVNFIEGRKGAHGQTPPCFRPTTIVDQTLLTMGIRRHPESTVLRHGGRRIVVYTTARVKAATWKGNAITVEAEFTPPVTGAISLLGIAKPKRVFLNGQRLPEAGEETGEESAWTWHRREAVLDIPPTTSGPVNLRIEGVSPKRGQWVQPPRRNLNFDFTRGLHSWVGTHDLMPLESRDDMLVTRTVGGDPYMVRQDLLVPGKAGDVLEVNLAVGPSAGPHAAAVFWGNAKHPGFAPERTVEVSVPTDGRFHTIAFPVGKHPGWKGQIIRSLRLDPISGENGVEVRIRSMRLKRGK